MPLLTADVLNQQAHEQQQNDDLCRCKAGHQNPLLPQLMVAFVDKSGDRAIGFAGEVAQWNCERCDALQQGHSLSFVIDQTLGLLEKRLGEIGECRHLFHGLGVFGRGREQVVAGHPGDQIDSAQEDLKTIAELESIRATCVGIGLYQRFLQASRFALELIRLPHDRVHLFARQVFEHAVLLPLDPGQWGQRDGEQQ